MVLLLKNRITIILRSVFNNDYKHILKTITYIGVVFIFLYGIYWVFHSIFAFLVEKEMFGESLMYKLFSMMFNMFFFLLIISSIISCISTFFKTKEIEFLFSTPINMEDLFIVKLIENGFFASWAMAIMSFPIIFALGNVYHANIWFYVVSIVLYLIFVYISTALGIGIVFIFSKWFLKYTKISIITLLILMILAIGGLYYFHRGVSIFDFPKGSSLQEVIRYFNTLEIEEFKYLPSGALSISVFNMVKNRFSLRMILLIVYAVLVSLFVYIMKKMYEEKYKSFSGIYTDTKKTIENGFIRWKFALKNRMFVIIAKDSIVFQRDPSQWGQLLVFLALLLLYIIGLVRSPRYFQSAFYVYLLSFFNMAFSAYIMATLSVRFVFPMISLEGRGYEYLMSIVGFNQLYHSKLFFNFIVSLIVGEILVTGTNIFLDMNTIIMIVSAVFIGIVSLGITFINISIGAIFPDFSSNNPSKIASGFGGIIAALLSLFYIGIFLWLIASPIKVYFECLFMGDYFNNMYFVIALLFVLGFTFIISVSLYFATIFTVKRR